MKQARVPLFKLQIVDLEGVVVQIPAGGALEADLTQLITRHIMAKGVGFLRTEAHVERDIRDGIYNAILELKKQTIHVV